MRKPAFSKTVYILGAGFSCEGGFPLQNAILNRIFSYDFDILSGPSLERQTKLRRFLDQIFYPDALPSLEDLFTLLDQTISKRGYCFGYNWNHLDDIRDALRRLILVVFHDVTDSLRQSSDTFYRSLAAYLINARLKSGIKNDPFSILSINWDSLLEDSIYWCIDNIGLKKQKVDVDFCCYTSRLEKSAKHIPSVLQKAKGIYNIKILKLHGSTNWLRCPNCNRLYTGLGSKKRVWDLYVAMRRCESCSKSSTTSDRPKGPELEPFFITPTFEKIFDNTHIQMVWHNAYTELAEADKVVFIGYSLPEADYHVRTLIRRAIRPNVPIEVVLTKNDEPKKNTPIWMRKYFPSTRYSEFFGNHRVTFYSDGVKIYFSNLLGKVSLKDRIKKVKQKFPRK